MEKQYVYILSSTSTKLQGIYKIGETKYHPEVRAHKLSTETGAIGRYEVEWYMEVPNSKLGEKILFDKFSDYRLEPKKEFFEADLNELIINSQIILNKHFKPIGQINIFRKKNIKPKFGKAILDNEKELRKWWEELPTFLKYVLLCEITYSESYIREHVEFYIEEKGDQGYIYDTMKWRWLDIFGSYLDFDFELETIYEQDVDWPYWFPEMLTQAAQEDYWWFKEILKPSLIQSISFEDLQTFFATDKLSLNKDVITNNNILDIFPFLNSVTSNMCDTELLMKLIQFPKMLSLDIGFIGLQLTEPTEKEWNGLKNSNKTIGSWYPDKDFDKLREFLQGIKLLKNTDFIRFKIAAEGTRESWGISYYLPSNSGIQIMHIIEECLPSAKAIILNNSGSFVNVEYAPHYV